MNILALAFAAQALPTRPLAVHEFPAAKTEQTLTNAISCRPGSKFSGALRWRLQQGLVSAVVKRSDVALPQREARKLVAALGKATDLLYVHMACSGLLDARIQIAYANREGSHSSTMMLVVFVRSGYLEVASPVPVSILP